MIRKRFVQEKRRILTRITTHTTLLFQVCCLPSTNFPTRALPMTLPACWQKSPKAAGVERQKRRIMEAKKAVKKQRVYANRTVAAPLINFLNPAPANASNPHRVPPPLSISCIRTSARTPYFWAASPCHRCYGYSSDWSWYCCCPGLCCFCFCALTTTPRSRVQPASFNGTLLLHSSRLWPTSPLEPR